MKNVYFIGIGGIGMSALARYFAFKGYNVSGYDKTPSELTAELIKEGIGVHYEDDITQSQRMSRRLLSSIPRLSLKISASSCMSTPTDTGSSNAPAPSVK